MKQKDRYYLLKLSFPPLQPTVRTSETLFPIASNMELLLILDKTVGLLYNSLKGFRSLTSAWHLEYFKIPLSKKKYLCNQKCRELKPTNQNTPKTTKQKLITPSPPLPHFFEEHFLCSPVTFFPQNHTK